MNVWSRKLEKISSGNFFIEFPSARWLHIWLNQKEVESLLVYLHIYLILFSVYSHQCLFRDRAENNNDAVSLCFKIVTIPNAKVTWMVKSKIQQKCKGFYKNILIKSGDKLVRIQFCIGNLDLEMIISHLQIIKAFCFLTL